MPSEKERMTLILPQISALHQISVLGGNEMEGIEDIALDLIEPNPNQPRKHFDDESLQELANSIKAKGLLEPIIIRPFGETYQIVCGERRWRACQLIDLESIEAQVRELSDEEAFEVSLTENVQRDNLIPIEEAEAYQFLMEKGLAHDEVARKIHKGRSYVTQKIRLLDLPECVRSDLNQKTLTEGHARQLLRFRDILRDSPAVEVLSGKKIPMWHIAAGAFAEDAWLDGLSVSGLKDKIDAWWWGILHAKWKLGGDKPEVKEAIEAMNKGVSPQPYPDIARYILRLWVWNISDVTLLLDQLLWHMDFWTYHSRIEKGLCWSYGCENQPTFKVKHHWCDSKDIPVKAIYRRVIRKCKQHMSRDRCVT